MPRTPCPHGHTRSARTPRSEARSTASRRAPRRRQPPAPGCAPLHSWLFQTPISLPSVRYEHRRLGEHTRDDLLTRRLLRRNPMHPENKLHNNVMVSRSATVIPVAAAYLPSVELWVLHPGGEER